MSEGRTAEIFAWGQGYVLKLYRDGYPAGEAEQEAAQARIAHAAGLRTPTVVDRVTVDGRPGIVFEQVTGPTLRQVMRDNPDQITTVAHLLAEQHAEMHGQTVSGLPRQRQRLQEQIHRAVHLTPADKAAVLGLLQRLPDGQRLCHGDFHPDNILMTPEGPVIIDWIDATQGFPLADVARTRLLVRLGGLSPHLSHTARQAIRRMRRALVDTYLERYRRLRSVAQQEIEAWEVVMAAARLSEGVVEQNEALLAIVRKALNK